MWWKRRGFPFLNVAEQQETNEKHWELSCLLWLLSCVLFILFYGEASDLSEKQLNLIREKTREMPRTSLTFDQTVGGTLTSGRIPAREDCDSSPVTARDYFCISKLEGIIRGVFCIDAAQRKVGGGGLFLF